jgi:hypothetical protein
MRSFTMLLMIAAATLVAMAADKPNFSGTWKMDPDKSVFGPVPPTASLVLAIDHKEPAISVHQTSSGPEGDRDLTSKYSTDGKETTNDFMGTPVKSKVRWDGNTLLIDSSLDAGGMEVKLSSKWTMAADGKTFTDVVNISSPQGDLEITYMLVKQ